MRNNFSVINIYKKKNIKSEVVTQLLYGETFEILKQNKNWLKIKNHLDNYKGYILKKKFADYQKNTHKTYKLSTKLYSKGLGWITTVIFTLLGGLFAIRAGVIKAMFVSGILMASTNLLFSLLAWSGKSEWLFALAVIFDDMAAAFATVAFVAFISLLVDRTYTATQYALLASIGTAGRTTLAASSGAMVDWLNGDWGIFFVITAIMVIPSLICLWFIKNKLKLQ